MENQSRPIRPRRSVLYVPAANERALAKCVSLSCDAVIFDLEDAVAPGEKEKAREALRDFFSRVEFAGQERIIRINAIEGEWGTEDLMAARACRPDAILIPKVATLEDVTDVEDALIETDAPLQIRLWAMIETPAALFNAARIADHARNPHSRLDCFVTGTNDLAKETGARLSPGRSVFIPWLMQIIAAARAGGLDVLDGVWNDFRDNEAFAVECKQAAAMGFDGKTLIHPAQIDAANSAFTPSKSEIEEARSICTAFEAEGNKDRGVISLDGRMVERLHLDIAKKLLAKLDSGGNAQ